jgi:hypothetical protein
MRPFSKVAARLPLHPGVNPVLEPSKDLWPLSVMDVVKPSLVERRVQVAALRGIGQMFAVLGVRAPAKRI